MAYSISFRAKDRTLEEADVTAAMKKILNGLESMGIAQFFHFPPEDYV